MQKAALILILLGVSLLFIPTKKVNSQHFTKVTVGPVVTTPSGSRSCNFIDFNNDNFQDLLITNGTSGGENNLLYINNQDGTFSTFNSPVSTDFAPSDGATCADYDNDGWIDIFVVNWYGTNNLFYQNNGGSGFTRITTGPLPTDGGFSETASWGDMNQDGLLDLYVTNSSGPKRNFLYQNMGSGAFQKVAGILPVSESSKSRCANWIDIDMDGDQDLFVSNEDGEENDLYRNDGNLTFTKITSDPLVSDNFTSHSSSWADYDNDGDFDVMIANYQEPNQLFNNDGTGRFTEVTSPFGPSAACSFSSSFGDFDNDGDLDLFYTNGFCAPNRRNFLYNNKGDGTFSRNPNQPMETDLGGSYGCAWGDYDNDGFLDLAVANWQNETQENALYHNTGNTNHWVKFTLEGTVSNRSAIGAVVRCKAVVDSVSTWQMRHVSAQSGYCSQNSLVVHFGLGTATIIDSLEVTWPSGTISTFSAVEIDRLYDLEEGGTINLVGRTEPQPASGFIIYPNPTTGLVTLERGKQDQGKVSIEVLDLSGKLVHNQHMQAQQSHLQLDIADLGTTGLFFIRIADEAGALMTQKILLK